MAGSLKGAGVFGFLGKVIGPRFVLGVKFYRVIEAVCLVKEDGWLVGEMVVERWLSEGVAAMDKCAVLGLWTVRRLGFGGIFWVRRR